MMIRLYCRRHEGHAALCNDCEALLDYALTRLSRCPFGNDKKSCRRCRIHCYSPSMRERIRAVMRYSGPRMIFFAPLETIKHL